MTAAAIQSIFGESDDVKTDVDEGPSKADRRQAQAEAKAANRAARLQAKAEAKAARAEERAAAKAARDEDFEATKAAKLAAREARTSDAEGDEEMRARAKADEAEAKAAAKLERQAEIQAKREARAAAKAARKQPTTEPDVDDGDDSERPIAVAAKLQQDHADAEQREREAREAKEQAAQAKREAAEARKAQKAELAAAREKEREEAAVAKAAAKAEREEAKAAARLATVSAHGTEDDHIVEAPREPKKSLIDRLRPEPTDQPGDDEDAPSNLVPTLAVVLGALGFVFSVVLAIGAFMVALNPQDDGGLFSLVSNICDALVGPLRGLFSFSGVNGESKEALVAWGLGALGYLVLGLFAQSFLRGRSEDE